ncbi:hypothetical protein ACJX0J_031153, partial [Zea mays]
NLYKKIDFPEELKMFLENAHDRASSGVFFLNFCIALQLLSFLYSTTLIHALWALIRVLSIILNLYPVLGLVDALYLNFRFPLFFGIYPFRNNAYN